MKTLAVVVGARPQFIKLAPLASVLADRAKLVIIHTGQHYDFELSDVFFQQLNLPRVDYHLGVGSASQATQVGKMMIELERAFIAESPDVAVIIGDTNSTLAGALAAAKMNIPLAHVEAGLRSKNQCLPEQINRVVADRLSDIMCCPTEGSVKNLRAEGKSSGVYLTGDILYDLLHTIRVSDMFTASLLEKNRLERGEFVYLTVHRAENADNPEFLRGLVSWLRSFRHRIIFPVHPRTEKNLKQAGLFGDLTSNPRLSVTKPVGIIESVALTKNALGVVTDSGGLQREAAFFGKKAYILRDETEWVELEKCGAVECLGTQIEGAQLSWNNYRPPGDDYFMPAAENIAKTLV